MVVLLANVSILAYGCTSGSPDIFDLPFDRAGRKRWIDLLAVFGAAPMFFYLLHPYVLKVLYVACVTWLGLNHSNYFSRKMHLNEIGPAAGDTGL